MLPPAHHLPSTADFLAAVRLGLGWGVLPDPPSRPNRGSGALVEVDPGTAVDVVLHWQQWKLRSASLDRVVEAVREAVRRSLR